MHYQISRLHKKSQISTDANPDVPESANYLTRNALDRERASFTIVSARLPAAAKAPVRESQCSSCYPFSNYEGAIMSTFLKFCLVSLVIGWTVPGTSFARPTQASPPQTTPTPSTDAEKPQGPQTKSAKTLPNPDASGKYHVGDGVTPPILLRSVEPDFPEAARTARVHSANCMVAITINADGNVQDANVVTSKPSLDDEKLQAVATAIRANCIKTIQQFRFKPAIFQGKPVPFEMKIQVIIDAF
jgi:hypothetical protein